MSNIVEVKTYKIFDFSFDTYQEAKDFEESNVFVFDDYERAYIALKLKDIQRYENMLFENKDALFEDFKDMCNSNSMGCLYPLSVINYVFDKHNIDSCEIWGDNEEF